MKFRIKDGVTIFDEEQIFNAFSVVMKIRPGSREDVEINTTTNLKLSPETKKLTKSMRATVMDIALTHMIKMTYLHFARRGGSHEAYVKEICSYTVGLQDQIDEKAQAYNKKEGLAEIISLNKHR